MSPHATLMDPVLVDELSARRPQITLDLLVDQLAEGAATFAGGTVPVRMNAALKRLLEHEPERERLRREVLRIAYALPLYSAALSTHRSSEAAVDVAEWELRTCAMGYRIRALRVGDIADAPDAVIVLVHPLVRRTVGHIELRDRFHLTPREMQVARLLASGCSTVALAGVLLISVHTARRHLEHVLTKLGVHSRGAAVALLRERY